VTFLSKSKTEAFIDDEGNWGAFTLGAIALFSLDISIKSAPQIKKASIKMGSK